MKIVDHQNTKIVATIGPASSSYEMLKGLIHAGVDVFRLNFSHGTHEIHLGVIENIVKLNEELGTHVSILADLQGPKLRVGQIENNALEIKSGDILTFVNEECVGTMEKIYMSYDQFAADVEIGEKVLVDDGKLELKVVETNGKDMVKLEVIFGGTLSSRKGVNLPNTKISLPSLTPKDLVDLEFVLTQPVNWVALSFVRDPKDVKDLRKKLNKVKHPAKIISKIEKPEAIERIDKIIKNSDAIMVARGDLGIEVPMEKLPGLQKMIVAKCIEQGRPVIVATQMMESMITNPSPTRAEITDVANAVLDGADAVMLSGESSVGKHPIKVVEAMNKIIEEAEKQFSFAGRRPSAKRKSNTFLSDAVCYNAAKIANEVDARAILGMTVSGYTAFKISSFRPDGKIYIFSNQKHILKTLNLVWGVRCYYYDRFSSSSTDETVSDVTEILKANDKLESGDVVINTGSMPLEKGFRTNMLKVTVVE